MFDGRLFFHIRSARFAQSRLPLSQRYDLAFEIPLTQPEFLFEHATDVVNDVGVEAEGAFEKTLQPALREPATESTLPARRRS